MPDRGGWVWCLAERKLAQELAAIERAKGTRGTIRGSTDGSGGAILAPPEKAAPTLADLGLPGVAGKKRSARAKKLAELPEAKARAPAAAAAACPAVAVAALTPPKWIALSSLPIRQGLATPSSAA